jgi:flagellar protein FliO/FliZ
MQDSQQWMMLLRAILSLAAVIGLILALAWAAKKFWRPERWGMNLTGIKIVHHLPLDSKKKIMVIEVEGKRFLVGVGTETISSLLEITGPSLMTDQPEIKYVEHA